VNRQNLRLLNLVRALVLCGQSFALWWFSHVDDIGLAVYPIVFALLVIAVVTAFSAWRCRWVWPVSHVEFFCHLLFDVCALSWLLYLSGGRPIRSCPTSWCPYRLLRRPFPGTSRGSSR